MFIKHKSDLGWVPIEPKLENLTKLILCFLSVKYNSWKSLIAHPLAVVLPTMLFMSATSSAVYPQWTSNGGRALSCHTITDFHKAQAILSRKTCTENYFYFGFQLNKANKIIQPMTVTF